MENIKALNGSFLGYKNSPTLDVVTPRTVFRKVLQTQLVVRKLPYVSTEPIVSPVVPEKAESPRPVETVFKIPSRNAADSNLEISLTGPVPGETFQPVLLKRGKKKKVRLSEFERAVDKRLPATTVQNHLVDLHASALSSATETIHANTELFALSQLSHQDTEGLHVLPSEPASAGKSSSQRIMLSSAADLQTPQRHAESDTDAGMTWQDQKDISMPETKCVDGTESVPKEEVDSRRKEQQESELSVEGGMIDSLQKETSPGTEPSAGVDAVPQQRTLSLGRKQEGSLHGDGLMEQEGSLHGDRLMEQQGSLHGDRLMELHSSPEEHHLSDISTPKSSTPVETQLPVALASGLRAFLQDKPTKRSVKAIVEHIIEELDKNMAPCVMGQGASEADLEEEPSASAEGTQISQRAGVRTPRRRASGQEAEQVEREAVDEAIQQPGDESKPRELSDLESEADVVSEIEMEPEVEDMSEAEMDSENNEPPVKTPAFVRTKAFQCTPLLSSLHTPKSAASKSVPEQPSKKQVPKESKKARRGKRQPGLSSCWVKKMFSHYAKMPVAKDAFQAVERCVSLYFKHLSDDLEAYTNHARRKTIESADLELLMKRQGLVTDKIPLNVLIERHLPLEYRKLLIPVATSGNKVIPLHPR
ncbi:UNVERIFIED_CONTAM: hypothetical protein K2H54_036963 [Gekko kuhli]